MAAKNSITHSRLTELICFDPATGIFTWKENRGGMRFAGKPSGHKKTNGYIEITVGGWRYLAHRLGWFFVHGSWPVNDIDHINGDRSDNRIVNLRDVLPTDNLQNSASS